MNSLKPVIYIFTLAVLPSLLFAGKTGEVKQLSGFPSYEGIVEYFFIIRDPAELKTEDFYRFRFARKPSGWYVYTDELSGNRIIEKQEIKLWDPVRKYLETDTVSLYKREINSPGLLPAILSNSGRYDFVIHPFYGYSGWEKDVIGFYKKTSDSLLTDNEIYGIALAYGSLASSILWSHGAFPSASVVKGENSRKKDLKKFLLYAKKSISYYSKLNRDYNTREGLSDLKTGNEIMARWYELELFGFHKEAGDLLLWAEEEIGNIYDPFWISAGAQILQRLEKNALLFSSGDADTYPLLYNQLINKLRPDVMILNLSLLEDPKYFNLLSRGFLMAEGLKNDFSPEEWIKIRERGIVVRNNESREKLVFKDITEDIREQLAKGKGAIMMDFGYLGVPFNTGQKSTDTLKILNATRSQVENRQFIVESVICNHFNDRPVYFTKRMLPSISGLLNPATLLDECFVTKLTNDADKNETFNNIYFNRGMYELIRKDFVIKLPARRFPARLKFFNLYLEMESTLIIKELSGPEDSAGLQMTMEYLSKYPPHDAGLSISYLNMIFSLYFLNKKNDIPEMFLRAFLVELEFRIRATDLRDEDPNDFNELKYMEFLIESLISSGIEPDIPGFREDLISFRRSIQNKLRQMPEIIIQ